MVWKERTALERIITLAGGPDGFVVILSVIASAAVVFGVWLYQG